MGLGRRIIIGLAGPFGAGCSTIADDLRDCHGWRRYSLSDAMRELAPSMLDSVDEENLFSPKYRSYQQDVGDEIRKKNFFAIPEKIVKKIQEDEKRDKSLKSLDIVIDGIRNPGEMTYLRDRYPDFFVVAVFAPWQVRWDRKREDYEGDQYAFERDDTRDSGELEPAWGQKVQLCVDRSDILISNERQFDEPRIKEELQGKIHMYIELMKKPGSMSPNPWELSMGQAYEASLMSTCCKRKVGAIIVREEALEGRSRSYIIAGGYNEAPLNVMPCFQRGGSARPEYCYRDEKIKAVLRKEYNFCPNCGKQIEFPEEFDLPFICTNSDCRARLGSDFIPGRMLDLCIAVHAEEAAILQASKFGGTQIEGSTLYTTTFPCPLCAKMIVQAGIKTVFFAEPYPQDEAIDTLEEANVDRFLFEGVKGRAYHRLFEPPPYKPNRR